MMDNFEGYLHFWIAAAVVYGVYKFGEFLGKALYEELRAKYIVWAWKRRK